ncbi:MAG TPA: hypothetical protein VHE61_15055 [Opitutaceae bacterium]|nr:hypothetical protein [Opitutaceae bacterium]
MNRRTFLQLAGTAGSGIALGVRPVFARGTPDAASGLAYAGDSEIPDAGWRMWPDMSAEWKSDRIFLPGEFKLADLPVRPPTGGWSALTESAGRGVTLPATVEQFDWGTTGFRPYHNEYKFETSDDEVKNGAYYGVSWWWREITIPADAIGHRILLHIRGARQRAEVFLNHQLVGYSILEELPFVCDLSAAARAGANQLAIRITNPGGRLDWVDGARIDWAGLEFQKSHGFGGLDRGMRLSVHGDVRVADAWVLNTPAPRKIKAHAEIENVAADDRPGRVRFAVIDPRTNAELTHVEVRTVAKARGNATCAADLSVPDAQLWDLATPVLYRLRTSWLPDRSAAASSKQRDTPFGFRWIGVDGLGHDAVIRLNGRRIRIYTSISWGFWALNGLFPSPELAAKEVKAAKGFNLNCLNFHRNLPKPEVLDLQDREGLLRCVEPGGGSQAVTPRGRTRGFAERYMEAKILGMIRECRTRPSVVHYIIQNEGRVDPTNPALLELFAVMHAADPSRTIVGTDGFVMRNPQAWEAAYQTEVRRSLKPATLEGGAAGWWVDHSGHATDVWQDVCYQSPRDYYYQSPNRAEIVEWGEMKGPASSDDHVAVLDQIRRHGGSSYDRLDHEQVLAAYDAFIDRWGFRTAFPSTSLLFRSIGQRAYDSWGQLMENVRISDETDMAAISGWESTAIENHSGLVDNFRDYKADPAPIARSLMPLRPVAKQRQLVFSPGERAVFDIYLLNDTAAAVTGELTFRVTGPDGSGVANERMSVPAYESDRLSYLVREAVTSEPLRLPGIWRATLELSGRPDVTHETELLVVGLPTATETTRRVGLADVPPALAEHFAAIPGVTAEPFGAGTQYDLIVFSGAVGTAKAAKVDADGADIIKAGAAASALPAAVLADVMRGVPLLFLAADDAHAVGVARQLADLGAFRFDGMVGTSRASWMGAWYFVREHPLYEDMPVNQAMGLLYQVKSGGSNGWRVDGDGVEVVAGYGRDHDRHLGAGTLTAKLGGTRVVMHHITGMHPALLRRFLANAVSYLR